MESKLVVSGEASETESEDESNNYTEVLSKTMTTSNQGEVITGEDSESDSETEFLEVNLVFEDINQLSVFHSNQIPTSEPRRIHETLLIKKLKESNRQVYKDIEGFSMMTITEAIDCLNGIEQDLLKSQITLQGALTALRGLNSNSSAIKNKLKDILSSKFFPTVNKCCE